MRVGSEGFFELTYCTNIHPANGWDAVEASLQSYAPALKASIAPGVPFGIGLRLSGVESYELLGGDRLKRFQDFLETQGLYVFTLNGFPHGPFHHQPVKADVHAPDWRTEERVQYTLRLAQILAALLPEHTEGGISTSPLSYKSWIDPGDLGVWEQLTGNIVRVAEALVRIQEQQGKQIHLDIEPEPDGLLENSSEVVDFYQDWLLGAGAKMLAHALDRPVETARSYLLDHIRVCWDTCHMAVAYEDPVQVLDRFERSGIRVGKVQISSALKVLLSTEPQDRAYQEQALRPFAESTYLHQVIQRNHDGTSCQYPDLGDALDKMDPRAAQWRIHFHVPIFVEHYGSFLSTQEDIRRVLTLLHERRFCRHLEIETYTWEVLPPTLKKDLHDSICREYGWVLNVFD